MYETGQAATSARPLLEQESAARGKAQSRTFSMLRSVPVAAGRVEAASPDSHNTRHPPHGWQSLCAQKAPRPRVDRGCQTALPYIIQLCPTPPTPPTLPAGSMSRSKSMVLGSMPSCCPGPSALSAGPPPSSKLPGVKPSCPGPHSVAPPSDAAGAALPAAGAGAGGGECTKPSTAAVRTPPWLASHLQLARLGEPPATLLG